MNDRIRHRRPRCTTGGNQTVGVVVLVGWFGLLGGCQSAEAEPDSSRGPAGSAAKPLEVRATRVEVAVINPSAADLVLGLPGEVEPSRDAKLAAPMGGYVEKVNVQNGDKVYKGQILAQIDTATHVARRSQAKVALDTAKRELKRAEKLKDTLPGAQLDAARSQYDAAKAAYRTASLAASRSVMQAPFRGVVADVNLEVGEVAPPGVPLIRVVQLEPVKVSVSLSDRDVLSVKQGMKASVTTDARGAVVEGEVVHINPAADLRTRAFLAEIEVKNENRELLPGMIAQVQLQADVASKQIVINQDWLVTKPGELGVFVNADDVAKWHPVQVGPIVRSKVIILGGLKPGDELITTGHRELAEGDKLIVARRGACCTDGRVVYPKVEGKQTAESKGEKPAGSASAQAKAPD